MARLWTDEQRELFETGSNGLPRLERVAVSADAGAGKTSVLSQRIEVFLQHQTEARILCVSFTEKSAADLKERLSPFPQCEVYTIHGYCFRIVNEFGGYLGLPPVLSILDTQQAETLLWQAFEKVYRLSKFQDFGISSSSLFAVCENVKDGFKHEKIHSPAPYLPELQHFAAQVLEEFEQSKRVMKSLEFSDLEKYALALLQKKEVRSVLQQRYAHLFVDEFQDTSQLQMDLVKSLLGPQSLLFVVGDSKQSIYRFRGADVAVFEAFSKSLPAQKKLTKNFRSHPEILDAVNHVCDGLIPDYAPMQAGRIEKQNLFTEAYPISADRVKRVTCTSDAQGVLQVLKTVQERGIDWSQVVLLLERVKGNEPLFEALVKAGVPITLSSAGSAGMNEDLLAFLELWIWACEPWQKLRAVNVLLHFKGETAQSFEVRYEKLLVEHQLYIQPSFTCEQMLFALNRWFFLSDEWGALFEQFQVFVMRHQLDGDTPVKLARQLAGFLKTDFAGNSSAVGLTDLLITPPPAQVSGALRVMTVHASKGLEFPVVILAALQSYKDAKKMNPLFDRGQAWIREKDENSKPIANPEYDDAHALKVQEEKQERARLLYVAMTRAQEALYFVDVVDPEEKKVHGWAQWIRPRMTSTLPVATLSTPSFVQEMQSKPKPIVAKPLEENAPVYGPARTGVTALAKKLSETESEPNHKLQSETSLSPVPGLPSASSLGTKLHSFLEHENWESMQSFDRDQQINFSKFWKWKESPQGQKVFGPFLEPTRVEREFAFEWNTPHGIVTGRMDRVVFFHNAKEAWIIDYKIFQSSKKGIELAIEEYRDQLRLYRDAVKELTPTYEVRCFILDVLGRNSPDSQQLLHQVLHKT